MSIDPLQKLKFASFRNGTFYVRKILFNVLEQKIACLRNDVERKQYFYQTFPFGESKTLKVIVGVLVFIVDRNLYETYFSITNFIFPNIKSSVPGHFPNIGNFTFFKGSFCKYAGHLPILDSEVLMSFFMIWTVGLLATGYLRLQKKGNAHKLRKQFRHCPLQCRAERSVSVRPPREILVVSQQTQVVLFLDHWI